MKRLFAAVIVVCLLLSGCAAGSAQRTDNAIVAATAPIYELTAAVIDGTDLVCEQLVTEPVSCLHDYSLSVEQMKTVSAAKVAVLSGLGLEDFMADALAACDTVIDLSAAVTPLTGDEGPDPHWWLSPENMALAADELAAQLGALYPRHADAFAANAANYAEKMHALTAYGEAALKDLSCRELVTFHDGFSYFADAFGLTVAAMEIESGSEPSARDLEAIIGLVKSRGIPAVFTETNGDTAAAGLVSGETGAAVYSLSTAMDLSSGSYEDVMKANFDTVKEALQ